MAIVETRYGKLRGSEQEGLHVFRGVPFASPPVGERRWLAPEPPAPWSGVREATDFGPAAHQPPRDPAGPLGVLGAEAPLEDEDCLTLNVWTPGLDGARRPVLVWIHGGAFNRGSGSSPIYDGATLARRGDVVVVTVNYRLGALGFLNLREATRGRIPATGNEGLLDQVLALRFVRENVAAFGGDPGCVTIFGESAGGMSVGSLLGLPAASGLFHRAIPQSGASSTAHELDRALRVAERLLDTLGISPDDVDALRSLAPQTLVEAGQKLALLNDREIGGMIFQPVIDGAVLQSLPLDAVRSGSADDVRVLAGATHHEWRLFSAMDPGARKLDADKLAARLARNVAEQDLAPLVARYREIRSEKGDDVRPSALFDAMQTDRVFRMPALRLAEALAARGGTAYQYAFGWPSPLAGGALGACHAIDIGFVFGTHDLGPAGQFFGRGPAAEALCASVQDAWLAFARAGDPSTPELGSWPAYGSERRATLTFGEKNALEDAPFEAERAAWDGYEDGRTLGRL